jgi:glucose-1-phosphate cytidylyltransferase
VKTVILAGGYGTRIRDVADDIPKPMIPIGPYPILYHILKIYSYYNKKDFIICLGYKGEVIKNFFINLNSLTKDLTIDFKNTNEINYHQGDNDIDWKLKLIDTGLNAMTGARINKIKNLIDEENFLLTYGDGVSDINIDDTIKFHKSHGKILTVAGVRPPGRFGEIISNKNNEVIKFNEKPQVEKGRISGGFFVANKKIFDFLNDNDDLVFEESPIQELVSNNQMMIYKHDGFWLPMDTSREYQILNKMFKTGNTPWIL